MTGSEAWPDLSGRLVDGGHLLPVRVYYEDTDFSGWVYHASYLRFMERGRSDFLRLCGISHDALDRGVHGERLAFAVRHMTINFLRPARIDDVIEVDTRAIEIGGARIMLAQTVRRGSETLVKAEVTVALVSAAGEPRRLPAEVRERLQAAAKT
jgi:acyl-CoA thioester hydrolase